MIDFSKLYITKLINYSSSLLKLTSEKIVYIQILKESLLESDDLELLIKEMKKITELSKMAIHLSEIYSFCNNPEIDFTGLSIKFKEQSQLLNKDIVLLLEIISSEKLKEILIKICNYVNAKSDLIIKKTENTVDNNESDIARNNKLKEDFILSDDDEEENSYEFYVKTVLFPIRELDSFLQRLEFYETPYDEMDRYQTIIEKNAYLSQKYSFELIANMHFYFSGALKHIMEHRLIVDKDLIEKMRACLIVIAALVRQKDVDITNYLNKADKLGKLIQNIKG